MTRLWRGGERIEVELTETDVLIGFTWRGEHHAVQIVAKRWRVDAGWWRLRIWREHYKLTTHSGLLVIVYRDLASGAWYLQRLYD